jgi:hypothetical protein
MLVAGYLMLDTKRGKDSLFNPVEKLPKEYINYPTSLCPNQCRVERVLISKSFVE